MFAKFRERRQTPGTATTERPESRPRRGSNATTRTTASRSNIFAYLSSTASASSSQLDTPSTPTTTDFFPSRPSFSNSFQSSSKQSSQPVRPKTSDGLGTATYSVHDESISSLPPILPPIPSVATRYSKFLSLGADSFFEDVTNTQKSVATKDTVQVVNQTNGDQAQSDLLSNAHPVPLDRRGEVPRQNSSMDPAFFSRAPTESRMEATMFPKSETAPTDMAGGNSPTLPASGRAFVDSRDRSYYPPLSKPLNRPLPTPSDRRLPPLRSQTENTYTRGRSTLLSPDQEEKRSSAVSAVSSSSAISLRPSTSDINQHSPARSIQNSPVRPMTSSLDPQRTSHSPNQNIHSSGPPNVSNAQRETSNRTARIPAPDLRAHPAFQTQPHLPSDRRGTQDVPRTRPINDLQTTAKFEPRQGVITASTLQDVKKQSTLPTPTISPKTPLSINTNSEQNRVPPAVANSPSNSNLNIPPRPPTLRTSSSETSLNRAGSSALDSKSSVRSLKTSSKSKKPITEPSSVVTIGTPYQDTSAVFPLPKHISTRPKDAADTANVAGVSVPTHVTRSGWSSTSEPVQQPAKRKTGFLKSMGFLGRKKSNQETDLVHKASIEEQAASEEAFAKQKTVAVIGVNELPADFDPRIRGKGVHDFSSPRRGTRTFSQDSNLLPSVISPQQSSSHSTHANDAGPRRSVHSPVFREHLTEAPSGEHRASSLNAERLENKTFVQRASANGLTSMNASGHSAFARQSHQLDPAQAGHALEQVYNSTDNTKTNNQESGASGSSADSNAFMNANDDRKSYMTATTYGDLSPGTSAPLSGLGIGHLSEDPMYGMSQSPIEANREHESPLDAHQSRMVSYENRLQPSNLMTPPGQFQAPGPMGMRSRETGHANTKDGNMWSNRVSSLPTPAQTPEKPSDALHLSPAPADDGSGISPNLSRGGSTKYSSNLQHRVSNASRFSFQLGGSAEEEEALEEKHRRNSTRPDGYAMNSYKYIEDDEADEDDFDFDEDAMNDMDEMELQNEQDQSMLPSGDNDNAFDGILSPSLINSTSPFLDHGQFIAQHARVRSDASVLTVNTNVVMRTPMATNFSPSTYGRPSDALEPTARATSKLRTEIDDNGAQINDVPPSFTLQKPPVPRRTSENISTTTKQSVSDVSSNGAAKAYDAKFATTGHEANFGSASAPLLQPTGFNFGDFKDFRFADEPDSDMPSHQPFNPNSHLLTTNLLIPSQGLDLRQSGASSAQSSRSNQSTVSSKEESAPYYGRIGQGIRARNAAAPTNTQYATQHKDDSHDDIYFDDGRFEQDIQHQSNENDVMDEERFDDSNFLETLNKQHREKTDGASEHGSVYEASDLISTNAALFPKPDSMKYARRVAPSALMPPLSTNLPTTAAKSQPQHSLYAYHAALANAAHQAASQGRFERQSLESAAGTGLVNDSFSTTAENPESTPNLGMSGANASLLGAGTQPGILQLPRFSNLDFDFGIPAVGLEDSLDDDYDADDDIIAAANADALALDNEGFYGQEFGFYAKARPDSDNVEAINGGFFGDDGDDGLTRNRSIKEPNLTPITERSEFSTRNSFINTNHAMFSGPASAGAAGPASPAFSRWPISTLPENEITSFDDLRRWRASAFGGSNDGSLHSSDGRGTAPRPTSAHSPTLSTRSATHISLSTGGLPMSHTYSNESSSAGSNDLASNHRHQQNQLQFSDSKEPSSLNPARLETGEDLDVTPRKPSAAPSTPNTARKVAGPSHSRNGSDSITYIHEPGDLQQPPRWVLERRRTDDHGQAELIEREIVPSGWI